MNKKKKDEVNEILSGILKVYKSIINSVFEVKLIRCIYWTMMVLVIVALYLYCAMFILFCLQVDINTVNAISEGVRVDIVEAGSGLVNYSVIRMGAGQWVLEESSTLAVPMRLNDILKMVSDVFYWSAIGYLCLGVASYEGRVRDSIKCLYIILIMFAMVIATSGMFNYLVTSSVAVTLRVLTEIFIFSFNVLVYRCYKFYLKKK